MSVFLTKEKTGAFLTSRQRNKVKELPEAQKAGIVFRGEGG